MVILGLSYLVTGVAFLALDAIWLGTMGTRLYRPLLGHLVRDGFALAPAMVFYLLYVAGIVVFAVQPALDDGRWTGALWRGLALGLIAYGTYDLTNQATLRDWPLAVTVIDMAWGTFATGLAATAGYLVVSRWLAN